jgi:peptidoglycan-associated lipoprotein
MIGIRERTVTMRRRPSSAHALIAILIVIAIAGCAKKPMAIATSAPPPTRIGPPTAVSGGEQRPPAAPSSNPASVGSARPSQFTPTTALGDIHFDFDRYDLRPADLKVLDVNAAWLKDNFHALLLIEGHADERGTNEYNLALGERRTKTAVNYLVSQGVQASRINTISYGEERPRCADRSEACWARNRRAHFLVKAQ